MSNIEIVSEKNNFITVSDFTVHSERMLFHFEPKSEILWRVEPPAPETAITEWEEWIKVNGIYKGRLLEVDFNVNGSYEYVYIETSLDNMTWNVMFEGVTLPVGGFILEDRHEHQTGSGHQQTGQGLGLGHDHGEEFIFLRIRFVKPQANWSMTRLEIWADVVLFEDDIASYLSDVADQLIPTQLTEENPLLHDLVQTYLKMLEDNEKLEYAHIDPLLKIAIHIDELIELGAINVHPIDKVYINYG
jgi:hypothetical protein